MTPWLCAQEMADFLREQIKSYDEKAAGVGEVYAGFLPLAKVRGLKKEMCPHIVVRPHKVEDKEKPSVAKMAVYVVAFDDDAESLYHTLEFLRFSLLSKNPIKNRWKITDGTLETSIPDEQPYPKLWGRMDFDVALPRAQNTRNDLLGRM